MGRDTCASFSLASAGNNNNVDVVAHTRAPWQASVLVAILCCNIYTTPVTHASWIKAEIQSAPNPQPSVKAPAAGWGWEVCMYIRQIKRGTVVLSFSYN